jgi:hypothetical protein
VEKDATSIYNDPEKRGMVHNVEGVEGIEIED